MWAILFEIVTSASSSILSLFFRWHILYSHCPHSLASFIHLLLTCAHVVLRVVSAGNQHVLILYYVLSVRGDEHVLTLYYMLSVRGWECKASCFRLPKYNLFNKEGFSSVLGSIWVICLCFQQHMGEGEDTLFWYPYLSLTLFAFLLLWAICSEIPVTESRGWHLAGS